MHTCTGIASTTAIATTTDSLIKSLILIPSDYTSKDFSVLEKKFVFEWEWTMEGHKNGLSGHYTGWLDLEGNPDGYGILRILDGSLYCGNWTEGLRAGNGVYTSINGALFSGSWLNDRFQGRGVYVSEFDQVYTGDFENGLKHGSGVETWEGGARYVGNYQYDKRNGTSPRSMIRTFSKLLDKSSRLSFSIYLLFFLFSSY